MYFLYSLPTEKLDKIRLLDGDKLLSLFAFYFKRTLDQMGAIQEEIIKNGAKFNPYDFGAWKVGTAQTAYANGSSVYFLRNVLKIEAKICPTGVKNLHPAAHHFDVGKN